MARQQYIYSLTHSNVHTNTHTPTHTHTQGCTEKGGGGGEYGENIAFIVKSLTKIPRGERSRERRL